MTKGLFHKCKTILKNHPKKLASAAVVGLYAIYLNDTRLRRNKVFRNYCELAKEYGEQVLRPGSAPRRVTVLVNESAKNGKGDADFNRYALPLLHLAGIQVEILKPKNEKEMLDVAASCDLRDVDTLYVVGGDGTLSKVVAGLMERRINGSNERTHSHNSIEKPSLAVFPAGFVNSFVKEIFPENPCVIKWYCDSVLSVLAGFVSTRGLVEVTLDGGDPIYMTQFAHVGGLAEIERSKRDYWYWGSFKANFAYCWRMLKQNLQSYDFTIAYSKPCPGCASCQTSPSSQDARAKRSWLRRLVGRPAPVASPLASNLNENCGELTHSDATTNEISIALDNTSKFNALRVACGARSPTRLEVVVEGFERNKRRNCSSIWPTDRFQTDAFSAKCLSVRCKEHSDNRKVIHIDGEPFSFLDELSMKVKPNAIKYYVPGDLYP